jgi:hypothetical protein
MKLVHLGGAVKPPSQLPRPLKFVVSLASWLCYYALDFGASNTTESGIRARETCGFFVSNGFASGVCVIKNPQGE